ncbi:unnamed protein product [Phytophthora fragariaefolia]|uniref:Unnamed protein product n=1 Tax=Phytophthora fragariaefolia TaxID=1490495 RepID=A0A9W6YDT1_9STRA|nr:unnamed protein product [Phytophthora fragariaefolia]
MRGKAADQWRIQLSPVDARMLRFGLRVLFVFPVPSSIAAPYSPNQVRQSFVKLIHEDIPFLIDAKRFREEKTGKLWVPSQPGIREEHLIEIQKHQTLNGVDEVLKTTPLELIPARSETKLLSVKCCLLIDGSLVIGVNADHCVVDAGGLAHLMKRWSEHYLGVASSNSVCFSHDRRRLFPSSPASPTISHPEYRCICHALTQNPYSGSSVSSDATTSQHYFHLTPVQLRNLKSFAALGDESPPFSTLDCVTALLTWLITRSRGHGSAVQVSTAVNFRCRLQSPLPDHFTGNAVLPALSIHPAQDLQAARSCAGSLHFIARRVRDSITKFDDAYIRDTISLLAAHPEPATLQPAVHFSSGPDLLFSSWRGLGMADVNFGSPPAYSGPPTLPACDGVIIFLDQVGSQPGLDAVVFLETRAMHELLELWRQHVEVTAFAQTPPRTCAADHTI